MTTTVVPPRQPTAVPGARENAPIQPAWMGSSALAVLLTAVISMSGILIGQWVVGILDIGYGWAFAVAGLVIAAEMGALYVVVGRLRRAYQRDHGEPPMRRAA